METTSINRFSHLEVVKKVKYDWSSQFLRKNVSSKFSQSQNLNDFMASLERIYSIVVSSIKYIEKYFSI